MIVFLLLLGLTRTIFIGNIQEVIIIGAGISGLRASQLLTQNSIPHLLLQSRSHIGGRVAQTMFQGLFLDEGPSFLHDFQNKNNSLARLARERGASIVNATFSFDNLYYGEDEDLSEDDQKISQIQKDYRQLKQRIRNSNLNSEKNTSLQRLARTMISQLKDSDRTQKELLTLMLESQAKLEGSLLSKLSAKFTPFINGTSNDVFILGSFYKLFQKWSSIDFSKFKFNERVVSIDYSRELVTIKTETSQYRARRVICTIPLGLLQGNHVKFSPGLPQPYQNAIANIGNGIVQKIFVNFKTPFWQDQKGWINLLSSSKNNRYSTAFVLPHTTKHVLIFFVAGSDAVALGKMMETQIQKDLEEYLQQFLNRDEFQIVELKVTKWHLDLDTLGSYSYFKVGTTPEDFALLGKPIDRKLWFSGEHTTAKDHGSVHGAHQAGERAAREVLAAYQQLVSISYVKQSLPYRTKVFQKMMNLPDAKAMLKRYRFKQVE